MLLAWMGKCRMISMTICPAANKKLLEAVPHRKVPGIEKYVLIYRNIDETGWGTVVTLQDACYMGMTEDGLYKMALDNMRTLRAVGNGTMLSTKALYEDALVAKAYVPELLEEYLEEQKTDMVFVTVLTGKIFNKIADVFNDILHGMEVLCYVKDKGFASLQEVAA